MRVNTLGQEIYIDETGQAFSGLYEQFAGYWQQIKFYLSDLVALDGRLGDLQSRWENVAEWAAERGQTEIGQAAADGKALAAALKEQWAPNAERLTRWLPTWLQIDQQGSAQLGGLSLEPLTMAIIIAAIAALAWVAAHGLDVLKQYQIQRQTLEAVEQQTLTAEQAATLGFTAAPPPGLLSQLTSSIPIWAMVAGVVVLWIVMGSRR